MSIYVDEIHRIKGYLRRASLSAREDGNYAGHVKEQEKTRYIVRVQKVAYYVRDA